MLLRHSVTESVIIKLYFIMSCFLPFPYLKKGEELFKMVTLAMEDDLEEFVKNAQE